MRIERGVVHGLFVGLVIGLSSPSLSADALDALPASTLLARQTEDDDEALHAEQRVGRARERADDRATESGELSPSADEALRERLDREDERFRDDREKTERRLEEDKERDKKKAKRKAERRERRRGRGREEAGAGASGVAAEAPSRE